MEPPVEPPPSAKVMLISLVGTPIVLFAFVTMLAAAIAPFYFPWIGSVLSALAVVETLWILLKAFGRPATWLPGCAKKMHEDAADKYILFHCKRNPNGFLRLLAENADTR